ncbi:MAG: leucine-rich repeat domain-containing protein, partial [Rikenellaceae bacterium]
MRRAYSVAAYVVAFVMMAMFVSCTEDSEVDAYTPTDVPSASGMIDITLNVAMASEEDEELTTSTRVGVGETTSSGGWTFVWEEGDELTAATATGDTPTYTQLTMSYFNLFASSFSGTVESGTDLRLLYPKFESSTIDLSSQDGKISCYLISDGYVNATTAEPFTPTMKQLGSYMVVNLNLTGDNLTKYAIERLEFCDVPTAATISLTKAYDSANLLTDIVYGDIVADMSSGENRAITINDDGTGTARVYLNILPFTKAQGERITIKCTFVDTTTDKKYYAEKMIEAKNSDATFNRATLYTTTLNYDVASTFNELWALAEFSADDYPTSKTWYVSDATATEEDFAGLKEALEKANTNKDINVVMLNLESVPGSAFEPCLYLTSIELPTAMTIGDYAFADCPSLSSIELPAATTFGEWAFNYCESLTSIDLPAATSIGNVTFHQCTSLTSINLPEVKTIGEYAFRNASSLSSIELPVATTIGEGAFTRCESLTSIYLPAATSIENLAFDDCESLTSIDLPVATSIGEGAFVYCSSLTDISLGYEGDGVSSIGTDAFVTVTTSNIDLTIKVAEDSSITIVGTTLYTGNNTYTFKSINGDELWALADFTADSYPENKTWYVSDTTATISDDVDDFAGLKAALEKANGDKDINVVMLNLESVPGDAFRSCKSLTSIELPAATTIGVNAFKYCSALTSIELPVATTIGESAFYYCSALSSIELPVATTIGDYAFMGCTSITNISLGDEDGVLSIGTDAFWDVTTENIDLTIKVAEDSSITISGTTLNTDSESITFNSINGNELWALEDFSATSYPESKTWYVSDATAETDDFVGLDAALENANGDKDINVVMLNLESVPEKAFYRCSDLTSIELPVATTIGESAFYYCSALTSIELP